MPGNEGFRFISQNVDRPNEKNTYIKHVSVSLAGCKPEIVQRCIEGEIITIYGRIMGKYIDDCYVVAIGTSQ